MTQTKLLYLQLKLQVLKMFLKSFIGFFLVPLFFLFEKLMAVCSLRGDLIFKEYETLTIRLIARNI